MIRRPQRSTRTDTLFPYTTRFRSQPRLALVDPMQRLAPVLLGIGPEFGGIDVNEIHQHRPVETRGQILRHLAREGDDMADAALPDQRIDLAGERRSEERRVGKECVSTGRYRGAPYH